MANRHNITFNTEAEYNAFKASSGYVEPNVSYVTESNEVHYNPYVPETRVVAKYNVTSTSNPTKIVDVTSNLSAIEIDGVVQPSVVSAYTFNTTGEHTVKYTLTDSTSIGGSAFTECTSLTSIVIPSGVTSIGERAFMNCSSLTSINIPSGVTSIGNGAFFNCSGLTSIVIPNGVTSIGERAFNGCSGLTSIDIPNGVTSIGQFTFYECTGLTSVTIGSGVTSIGYAAFKHCHSLTSCTIGSGVTSIGGSAFDGCRSLTSIDIPSGVTIIGNGAFQGCSGLTSIVCNAATAPTIQSSTSQNVKTGGTLTVPQGSSGYDVWMGTGDYYLGKYNWTKVEQ